MRHEARDHGAAAPRGARLIGDIAYAGPCRRNLVWDPVQQVLLVGGRNGGAPDAHGSRHRRVHVSACLGGPIIPLC